MKKSIIFLLVIFSNCTGKQGNESTQVSDPVNLEIEFLEFDTIQLQHDLFSGLGFFVMHDSNFYFVDQILSQVALFDSEGFLIDTFLGKGEGPDQQNVIHGFKPFGYKGLHVVLEDFGFTLFDEKFQKKEYLPLEWSFHESRDEMEKAPDEKMLGLYEVAWKRKGENSDFLVKEMPTGPSFLVPITMSHPQLNAYLSENYYKRAFIFGQYSTKEKKINSGFGNRSDEYLNYRFIPNFDFFHFASKEDSILVSFAIDPLIHVFSTEGKLIRKFGRKGLEITTKYPITQTIEDAIDNYSIDLTKAGFYGSIFYEESSDLTFRTYFKSGSMDSTSRLQIYKGSKLIGDLEVPKRFTVIGKLGDFYFADGIIDEQSEQLMIYRFKI